jgi:hypothetical protein
MIETQRGVRNAAAIAHTPGIDFVLIGTGDLAMSLGVAPGDPRHEQACRTVLEACRAAHVPCAIFTGHAEAAIARRREGYNLVVVANDIDIVARGFSSAMKRFTVRRAFRCPLAPEWGRGGTLALESRAGKCRKDSDRRGAGISVDRKYRRRLAGDATALRRTARGLRQRSAVRTKGGVFGSSDRTQIVPTYIFGYEYSFSQRTGVVGQFYVSPSVLNHEDTDLEELLAAHVDRDLLAQVAVGDRRGHLGDVAHLSGQVAGHEVDVVGQVLPDAAHFDRDRREHFQRARAVVVSANGAETPRLLLMSANRRFPNGLANSSGLVGKYLTDTTGTEPLPFADPAATTHRAMLVDRGVHLLENLYLEDLATDGISEGLFVCLPLKITGATGSLVRPLAIV